MSSPSSATLAIDVRSRRFEARIANLVLALTVVAQFLAWRSLALAVAMAIATFFCTRWGFRRAGWREGEYRLTHIGWRADGRWLLRDEAGRSFAGELRPDSRVGRSYVWLRWDADNVRSMLLANDDLPDPDLRRLMVRLRIAAVAAHAPKTTRL
jgi:hypothetical protein